MTVHADLEQPWTAIARYLCLVYTSYGASPLRLKSLERSRCRPLSTRPIALQLTMMLPFDASSLFARQAFNGLHELAKGFQTGRAEGAVRSILSTLPALNVDAL